MELCDHTASIKTHPAGSGKIMLIYPDLFDCLLCKNISCGKEDLD